ncbi:MAG: DUF3081 family protein [Pseudomonadales bacterium]
METKIDVKTAYRAYQRILYHGTSEGDRKRLGGLYACTDYDGYAFTLTDGTVSLRVLFHNQLHIDSANGRVLARFRDKVLAVAGGS